MQQPQTVPIQLPSIPLLSVGGKGGSLDKDQLAAVMAAAQAAAAQAAAAVIAAAGVNVQTQLQVCKQNVAHLLFRSLLSELF